MEDTSTRVARVRAMPMKGEDREGPALETLVAQAAAGDELAWKRLWGILETRLGQLLSRPHFLGPVAKREDDRRNIIVEVMSRLREREFHRLRLFTTAHEKNPGLGFWTWLRVVTKRTGIDYMRAHPDYIDRRRTAGPESEPGRWVHAGTLPASSQLGGAAPQYTNRGTAAELLRHATASLPQTQLQALKLWIEGQEHADIALQLQLPGGAAEAERAVRAAIERLRRHFRAPK
jgi:DNA-directed RNA polymerase specialized sigma24 family protein